MQNTEGPDKRTFIWMVIVAAALLALAFGLGAEAGPECWRQGLKLC